MPKAKEFQIRFRDKHGRIRNLSNSIRNKVSVTKEININGAWINVSGSRKRYKIYKRDIGKFEMAQISIRNLKTGRFVKAEKVKKSDKVQIEYVRNGRRKDVTKKTHFTRTEIAKIKRDATQRKSKANKILGKFDNFFADNFHSAKVKKFKAYYQIRKKVYTSIKTESPTLHGRIIGHVEEIVNDLINAGEIENGKELTKEINKWVDFHKRTVVE